MFLPWLEGLSVTELDELGQAKGTTLAHELEKVLMSQIGDDQDRICDEFNKQVPWLSGTETSYVKFTTVPKGSVKSKIHSCFSRFKEMYSRVKISFERRVCHVSCILICALLGELSKSGLVCDWDD